MLTMPENIWIHGMGMMGASLARALKTTDKGSSIHITATVRTRSSREFILAHGLAEDVHLSGDSQKLEKRDFDLIILGLPVLAAAKWVREYGGSSLVTDMSSTRKTVLESAISSGIRFIGSHPMCGSEDAGPKAARPDLFLNRLCIVTPPGVDEGGHSEKDLHTIVSMWQQIGMHTVVLGAELHDLVLAYLSHAPHLLSSMLARVIAQNPTVQKTNAKCPVPITGGGLRDMLRIAGSNPEMWKDIMITNRENILAAMKEMRASMDETIALLESGSADWWDEWQKEARLDRNVICGYEEPGR